jgi:transcriptional regulator with XRE-family HTH domain
MGYLADRLAKNVKDLRTRKGLSVTNLARMSKLSTAHIVRIENQENWASEATLEKLANALGVDASVLFAGEIPTKPAIITDKATAEKILTALGLREALAGDSTDKDTALKE